MATLPDSSALLKSMIDSRNKIDRSFHIIYDKNSHAYGASIIASEVKQGVVYVGYVEKGVGGYAEEESSGSDANETEEGGELDIGENIGNIGLVVTKTRTTNENYGETTYLCSLTNYVEMDSTAENVSIYSIPLITDGIDKRDMLCYAELEPYKEDTNSGTTPIHIGGDDSSDNSSSSSGYDGSEDSYYSSSDDDHDSGPSSFSGEGESYVDDTCDWDGLLKRCDQIEKEMNSYKALMEDAGIWDTEEENENGGWEEVSTDGKTYHVRGQSFHISGSSASCPLCGKS